MKYRLSGIMDLLGGGTPKTSKPEYWNGDIPWLSVKDFNNDFRYVYETEKYITQLGLDNSSTKLLQAGDIIISARGTVGEMATIPFPMAFNQSCYGLRAKAEIVTQDFLYYLIKYNVHILKKNTHGSVFDTITRNTFAGIEVDIPPKAIQARIASILSIIDQTIELNQRINENLDDQMQSIFFEYFPSIYSDETGEIFGDMIAFSNGKKRPDSIGEIPVYGGNGVLAFTQIANAQNCVIIGRVGAYCGSTFLCLSECWVSDNAIQAKSKFDESQLFVFYLLKNAELPSRHIGTGQPLMTQGILNSIPVKIPARERIQNFIQICTPMQNKIAQNLLENQRLSALRDTLLPKLISSELDVSDLDL